MNAVGYLVELELAAVDLARQVRRQKRGALAQLRQAFSHALTR